jgi:hypothetical protein
MMLELLIAWFATWLHRHQKQVIAYLRKENRILPSRLSLTSRPETLAPGNRGVSILPYPDLHVQTVH